MIFIVGCGRTGTHWLASALVRPGVNSIGEDSPLFQMSVESALRRSLREQHLPAMVAAYRKMTAPAVDKCHPNLWIAHELAFRIPGSRFIFTRRTTHAVVRSMLNHQGSLRWARENHLYAQSCYEGFLGRFPELEQEMKGRTLAARCAARSVAHRRRADSLAEALRSSFIFDYDHAFRQPVEASRQLSDFVGWDVTLKPRSRILSPLSERQSADVDWVLERLGERHA